MEQMPEIASTPVTQDDLERLAYSFNDFGLRLLARVATATSATRSVAIAPVAIASELALILKGAGGTTATTLAQVLHLDGAHGVHVNTIAGCLLYTSPSPRD